MNSSRRKSNLLPHGSTACGINFSLQPSKMSELETQKNSLLKAARRISINHIMKLPNLIHMHKKYEAIIRNFSMLINLFRSDRTQVMPEALESTYGLSEFIIKSTSSIYSEVLSATTKFIRNIDCLIHSN